MFTLGGKDVTSFAKVMTNTSRLLAPMVRVLLDFNTKAFYTHLLKTVIAAERQHKNGGAIDFCSV